MSLPSLVVEVAFTTNPVATPTWVDISSYVLSCSIRRGRQTELDRIEAGSCTIVLSNHDRRFDPTYTAGPYYGNVLPMRRVRVSASHESQTYYLFTGYVDEWKQDYRDTKIAYTSIRATDGFKVLSLIKLNTSYSKELSSDRVLNVLTDVNWLSATTWILDQSTLSVDTYLHPAAAAAIYAGNSSVQASTLTNASALEHLQAVNDAESGLMFIGAGGDLQFYNRHRRLLSPYADSQATFSDTGGSAYGYHAITLAYDDAQLWNAVSVTINGSTSASTASDTASQTKYYVRTLERSGSLIESTSEATNAAQWLVTRYHEPYTRITHAAFKMINHSDGDGYISAVLSREIGDKVTVVRTPPGGGTPISQAGFIEGISHDMPQPGQWVTMFSMDPANAFSGWILDSTVNSVLDLTTIPTY